MRKVDRVGAQRLPDELSDVVRELRTLTYILYAVIPAIYAVIPAIYAVIPAKAGIQKILDSGSRGLRRLAGMT